KRSDILSDCGLVFLITSLTAAARQGTAFLPFFNASLMSLLSPLGRHCALRIFTASRRATRRRHRGNGRCADSGFVVRALGEGLGQPAPVIRICVNRGDAVV